MRPGCGASRRARCACSRPCVQEVEALSRRQQAEWDKQMLQAEREQKLQQEEEERKLQQQLAATERHLEVGAAMWHHHVHAMGGWDKDRGWWARTDEWGQGQEADGLSRHHRSW